MIKQAMAASLLALLGLPAARAQEAPVYKVAIARRELRRHLGLKDPPCGTVYNLTLSTDPQQKYVLVADGTNNMVRIFNRKDGTPAGSFGGNGRYAGQLHWIDAVAMDSKGNVYTGEVEDGKRIQKFVPAK